MAKRKTNSKRKSKSTDSEIPFEDAMSQLHDVVGQLESGNLTLSESLEHYELGVKNLKNCYRALEQVQKKIELLVDLDENGNLITRPFDDTATHQTTRKTTRQADRIDDFDNEADEYDVEGEEAIESDDIDDPNSLF